MPSAGADGSAGDDGAAAVRAAPRIREITRRLEDRHGPPSKTRRAPLEELLLTVLSQNTSDTNRDRAWEGLREAFDDWEAVRRAPREELEEAIRSGGLARQKAATIQRVLERLHRERDETSLSHLDEMDDGEALAYLSDFKGVGVKTAACVLCFSLRRPVLPVDTHVYRVSRRLGLVPEGATRRTAHRMLNETVPEDLRFPLHLLLIRHGREVCTSRSPECGECPLSDLCPQVGVEATA